jgi:hypothetical protein
MNPPAMFAVFSATKALAHVQRLPGSNVRSCAGIIPETFALGYKDLYTRKMEVGRSRANNKNSMTDSIDNIQKRTAGAMLAVSAKSGAIMAASASMRSAASASTSKRGVLVYV